MKVKPQVAHFLRQLRMSGVFYSNTAARGDWGLKMPVDPHCLSFHVVTEGSCWLVSEGAPTMQLCEGDVALVQLGREHMLSATPTRSVAPRVDLLPQRYLSDNYSIVNVGSGRPSTRLLCGMVSFDAPDVSAILGTLPPVVTARGLNVESDSSVMTLLGLLAEELSEDRLGAEAVAVRLADIIVVQIIRAWFYEETAFAPGLLAGLADPSMSKVLHALHDEPSKPWTIAEMARMCAMSRTSFTDKFRQVVGVAPATYLTNWRMELAKTRLMETEEPISRVGSSVSYSSESAFSKAFARHVGTSPSAFRQAARKDHDR
ncbi:AraC family transcriptional regulator [Corynebacterium appendicis]|uniref:AraC family transcriptional regulator n=1 Tax=Corynebacterium appendicis TaxID=163202 RepID=UPI00254C43DC|nr:AraC family transcriptional regulator [Corynebacterium appendicis]MDK8626444.1 AraC family transcriptional regulator [Corynebacterium appendicis]